MRLLPYICIPILALGLSLSVFFGVRYTCTGSEMFPTYYGAPFVFKQQSLGSSLTYYYSVAGLSLNVAVWSLVLILLRYMVLKIIDHTFFKKQWTLFYKIMAGVLVLLSCSLIWLEYTNMSNGFGKHANYWYWNIQQEAKAWGKQCQGNWGFFK